MDLFFTNKGSQINLVKPKIYLNYLAIEKDTLSLQGGFEKPVLQAICLVTHLSRCYMIAINLLLIVHKFGLYLTNALDGLILW